MNGVLQILARFGPARLAAMGAVTLALIGFFAFVILRVSQPAMGVLFAEMQPNEASAVIRELDTRKIPYESRDEGQTILVPKADMARIRMELAGKGLPSGGGVGYEIFDKGDAFSSTSFVQNINHLRALEGELARTIRTIGRVQSARVHLALPAKRLFERDREAARASIVLKLRGELGADQVGAIRHLVASAVEGLQPDNISIVDERGRLLASGARGGDASLGLAGSEDKRVALERRLRMQVEEIVAGVVGTGRARVQVAAELDLNRVESRSETFDPESRVVRSTQTRGETSTTAGGDKEVTVGNELPGAAGAAPAASPRDQSGKNEEVINYEISRTTRTEVLNAGRVKRLSVAVLVDGAYAKSQAGEATYQPRPKEDLDRIAALVRSAVGFDASRGDQIEVVNLPFADAPVAPEAQAAPSLVSSLLSPSREDVMRAVETGVIVLLTVLVLLVVVRPMVRRVLAPEALPAPDASLALAAAGPAGPAALAGPMAMARHLPAGFVAAPGAIGGDPHAMAPDRAARIAGLARDNPKQAAAVLRGWMGEG